MRYRACLSLLLTSLAAYAEPGLTTVAQPLELLGERALQLAQALIAGEAGTGAEGRA